VHEEERDKEGEGERERERERECVCEGREKRVRDQWKRSLCARETEGRGRQKRRERKKCTLFGMCIKTHVDVCARLFFSGSLCLLPMPSLCCALTLPMPSLCCALTFLLTCCNMRRRGLHFHLEHQGQKSTAVAEKGAGLVPKPTTCGPIHA